MSTPLVGRAQLLAVVARLPRQEWATAAAPLGFFPRLHSRKDLPSTPEPLPPGPTAPPATATQGAAPAHQPADLPFWRVTARRRISTDVRPTTAPAWLVDTLPWKRLPESDCALAPPRPAALAPRARQALALRRHLAVPVAQTGPLAPLDLPRLCRLLAECRLPPRLPRACRTLWPGRVYLVLDLSPRLTPFHDEFWRWARRLTEVLGARVLRCVTLDSSPEGARPVGGSPGLSWRLDDGTPLVLLGDAGLYDPDHPRHRRWLALARRAARVGPRPLLLAPCPQRLVTAPVTRAWCCVLLERGAPLRPLRAATLPQRASKAQAGQAPERDPTVALLAGLAPGARTEPALLRTLRLLLADRGTDIGSEYAAWNHASVVTDGLACALRLDARPVYEDAFKKLPITLRRVILETHEQKNRHMSPLVRMEEILTRAELAATDPRVAALTADSPAEARELALAWAATLYRPGLAALQRPLGEAIMALARRRPSLLGVGDTAFQALATAWVLARRAARPDGDLGPLPPGLNLTDLDWLLDGAQFPVVLAEMDGALGLLPAASPQAHRIIDEISTDSEWWTLVPLAALEADATAAAEAQQGGAADTTPTVAPKHDVSQPKTVRVGELLQPASIPRLQVVAGCKVLELDRVRCPPWAKAIGHDGDGLFLELPEGRRLYWVPKDHIRVQSVAGESSIELPQGAWWDGSEHAAWLSAGRRLTQPSWAVRHGVDQFGRWAEFAVKGIVQRMRWLPPGAFLMGSPETEAGRSSEETRHPVFLTQGLWLADTVCTQALWRAVLSEYTSGFRGGDPVVQVSWDKVQQRFLPALNLLVPGLDARLPTEAEWEYACRARTTTPFWFGGTITTDQVNYDGNFPYTTGPKGGFRRRTVPVKILPANDWGLYQMHGNVWEWCADSLGDYPCEAVVDPAGPPTTDFRVLRGGYWKAFARWCRSAHRGAYRTGECSLSIGFRLAISPSPRPDSGQ